MELLFSPRLDEWTLVLQKPMVESLKRGVDVSVTYPIGYSASILCILLFTFPPLEKREIMKM